MSDEAVWLVDELLALFTDWEQIQHQYRGHLAGLLTRCSTDLGRTAGVHRELVHDVVLHVHALAQLSACMDGLESVLRAAEDRRQVPN